jgi:hypothetical protein
MWQATLQRQAPAIRLTSMTSAGMASQRRFAAVAGVLVVAALAGCGAAQPGPVAPSWELPGVTGGGVRALWQGAPGEDLTISGGLVLGVEQTGNAAQVHAVSALTGRAGLDDDAPGVAAAGTWPGAGRERRGGGGRSRPR